RQPQPHLPQQLAPGEPEAVAPAHPYEVLDPRALELRRRAAHEIPQAAVAAVTLAFEHHRRSGFLAPIANESESHPHGPRFPLPASRFPFYRAPHVARVHVGEADLDA